MSDHETLEDFAARFSSQFTKEEQETLLKLMLNDQSTDTNVHSSSSNMIAPNTPPPTQSFKRVLASPNTPHHGESRKVIVYCICLTVAYFQKQTCQ
jgi:hypothetical protein